MFNISDKVVCTKDDFIIDPLVHRVPFGSPKKGTIYVIEGFNDDGNILGLILVGIKAYVLYSGLEVGWDSRYFRKLTDIQEENRPKSYHKLLEIMQRN